jgi:hypothetical protein
MSIDRCLLCPTGTYSGTASKVCVPCAAGSWSATNGSVFCTSCPAGTESSVERATSLASCTACKAGYYSSAPGSAVCSACPAGRYCPLVVSGRTDTGFACTPGTYSQYPAASDSQTCVACPPGSFCPINGTISPVPCNPDGGTFSARPSLSTKDGCANTACQDGYFCPPGAGSPTACPAGSFSNVTNASSITHCTICVRPANLGYFCPGTFHAAKNITAHNDF